MNRRGLLGRLLAAPVAVVGGIAPQVSQPVQRYATGGVVRGPLPPVPESAYPVGTKPLRIFVDFNRMDAAKVADQVASELRRRAPLL